MFMLRINIVNGKYSKQIIKNYAMLKKWCKQQVSMKVHLKNIKNMVNSFVLWKNVVYWKVNWCEFEWIDLSIDQTISKMFTKLNTQ